MTSQFYLDSSLKITWLPLSQLNNMRQQPKDFFVKRRQPNFFLRSYEKAIRQFVAY